MVAKHLHMKSFTFTNKIQCTQEERNVFPSSGVWIIFTLRLWPHQSAFSPRKADIKAKSIRYPLSALLWTICNWGQHWQIDPLPPLPHIPGYLLSYIQPPTGGQPLHWALTSTGVTVLLKFIQGYSIIIMQQWHGEYSDFETNKHWMLSFLCSW